ncbi:uncharacterized protein B0I36DRAFT_309203 [Microdochium trichocladiopsis]|uniref:Uncharacterized protein n=1 Tax=Microdochium trichocladiopsis TaxID=1682393 RepID=A0A9P8YGU0_9PEZI|nr:uncharacterized protein B0I36DRAFT_309203 [Microdochium trichocladiopsis]KAH7039742.1 hypothetical protein B0I36DRAFT_309203 [Microdochium trichocladiopsis]
MADQASSSSTTTTTPISPARFAAALKDLSAENLALKVFELRNSIAHLDYSNAELRPYAEGLVPVMGAGSAAAATDATQTTSPSQQQEGGGGIAAQAQQETKGDQDCIDAIAENEVVIARMLERIDLIRAEVTGRGLSWDELSGVMPERDDPTVGVVPQGLGAVDDSSAGGGNDGGVVNGVNGTSATTTTTTNGDRQEQHEAWRDGTFTTGTIRSGGPGLSDEELLRRLQAQTPGLGGDDDDGDEDGGIHL